MHSPSNTLWLCLRFHRLPLQALQRAPARDKPPGQSQSAAPVAEAVAVIEKQRVYMADENATELGVRPGMSAATVRALSDDISLVERDTGAEERCLQQLCCWAYSLSPSLFSDRGDSLLLEIGTCLAVHRGLDNLLAHIRAELSCRCYSYCPGLAATPKAAWLLSHADDDDEQSPLEERLGPLPLSLLTGFPRQVDALARAGLWSFADILALPQRALARRCGKDFLENLQQILGTRDDRHPDYLPPATFSDDYWFGYEVKANQELQPAIQLLLQSLCRFLRSAQLQCREIQWQLVGINRRVRTLEVRCSQPQSDWEEWYRLTGIHIEQLQLDIGVEALGLYCARLDPGSQASLDLFNQHGQREPLHSLLDRLQNRLGIQCVEKIACRDEHLPEYAGYSSCDSRPGTTTPADSQGQRPFWLMPQPQPLRRHKDRLYWNGALTLLEGPERIEDQWWQDPVSRDYYVARDSTGHQYWVYRDRLHDHWYIQGVFA